MSVSNLGGKGPDFDQEEELRFSNIGIYDDKEFDLVITVMENSSYIPKDNSANGQNGRFGQINLEVGGMTVLFILV